MLSPIGKRVVPLYLVPSVNLNSDSLQVGFMVKNALNLTATDVSLSASFAGIYAILSVLPAFKILGGEGFINTSAFIEPVIGLVLGPYVGSLSVLIGRTIANTLVPSSPLGPFSPVPGILAAFSSGMTSRGRWRISALLLSGLIIIFLAYPPNHIAPVFPYYVWLHAVAVTFLVLSSRLRSVKPPFSNLRAATLLVGLGLTFFPSTMTGQLAGTLVWEFLLGEGITGIWRTLGTTIMAVFPVERTLITIIACLLGGTLVKALGGLSILKNRPKGAAAGM